MAIPTSALSALGLYPTAAASTQILREDLIDVAINLDKEKTAAVFQAAPKTEANGFIHEWLLDQLPGTSTAGVVEGNDWSAETASVRVRMNNCVQSFRRDFGVSNDQIEYSTKGRAPSVSNEYEHQVENFLIATEQSIDARSVANGTAVASASAAAATDAALMGGIRNWQATATANATSNATSAAVTNVVMINILGAWSRTKFLNLHETMYNFGAAPNTLAVDSGVKADITLDVMGETAAASATASATAGALSQSQAPPVIRQIYTQSTSTEFSQDVQFIRTDFGRVAVLVDRFIPQSATATNARSSGGYFLYDRSKIRFAFWRPLRHYAVANTGDAVKAYIHAGVTIEVLAPRTVGVGYNITT